MMQHYRKKPVIIRAKQYDGTKQSAVAIINTLRELSESDEKIRSHFHDKFHQATAVYDDETFEFTVTTTEGVMKVSKSDYVLVGTQGEIYPCKPQMFTDSYEMVDWEKDCLSDLWPESIVNEPFIDESKKPSIREYAKTHMGMNITKQQEEFLDAVLDHDPTKSLVWSGRMQSRTLMSNIAVKYQKFIEEHPDRKYFLLPKQTVRLLGDSIPPYIQQIASTHQKELDLHLVQCKEEDANLISHLVEMKLLEIRKLTPLECERLQGFPDLWTR